MRIEGIAPVAPRSGAERRELGLPIPQGPPQPGRGLWQEGSEVRGNGPQPLGEAVEHGIQSVRIGRVVRLGELPGAALLDVPVQPPDQDPAPLERLADGGPVESGRGFVLHSAEYRRHGTIMVTQEIGLTATVDILKDLAEGRGPRHALLALGYAGWGPGQLDGEIQQNAWLHVPADEALVFDRDLDSKWERSIAKIGVDIRLLSGDAGHA